MIKITMNLDADAAKAMLSALSASMKDMTPVLKPIGETIRTSIVKNFEVGGRPQGWMKLSPLTVIKARGYKTARAKGNVFNVGVKAGESGKKILVSSGRLMKSINVQQVSAREVVVGTNVVYAAIHHFGGQAGRGRKVTIPARPYMLIQKEDWEEIARIASDYLLKQKT
jgi:phage virion morphogenesis protein